MLQFLLLLLRHTLYHGITFCEHPLQLSLHLLLTYNMLFKLGSTCADLMDAQLQPLGYQLPHTAVLYMPNGHCYVTCCCCINVNQRNTICGTIVRCHQEILHAEICLSWQGVDLDTMVDLTAFVTHYRNQTVRSNLPPSLDSQRQKALRVYTFLLVQHVLA